MFRKENPMKINPYLNFPGNTEEAFNFYRSIFGGDFTSINRIKEMPESEKLAPEDQEKIMHIALPIGEGNKLMATDALESMGQTLTEGNNISLILDVDTEEEADDLYGKLAVGGTVEMPMEKMFWGSYYGLVVDKFGIRWMINCPMK
ncbi:MAG: Glyoxalase/bleomycin resistance protein/dioxygenase [candidate division WWE3 bacterium GW2011_GWF2_42_42]|uniref:Glyoxalase/bleomycin resistance protein/dioxygenase n=3 Tax=Katanobacteria TaxID=422282 RepID=A0A0G1AI74_UNCKA|nr:MAG: Glyoxalase/bleomycin resistance protein/dioxygenase [candidate division WWE3 bacterium GW2011_GWF2_42_42]